MERYKEYKDSGVLWIGQIPSHWNLRRLKTIATCNDESLTEKYDQDKEIEYVEIGDVDSIDGIKSLTKYKFKDAPSRARRITRVGDIIISTVRTYLKAIAFIEVPDLIVSTGFAVLRPIYVNPKYLAYSTMCDGFTDEVLRYSIGISYPAISSNDLLRLKVPLPPICEQEKIVCYIESKTSKIDAYIAEKEKEVKLLYELKEAEIAKVVTQGLNPNVKMKDSGISWIGMIPEHWDVKRIASLFIGKVNTNTDFAYKHAFKFNYGTLVPKDEVGDVEEYRETYVKYQVIQKDDILINGLNLNYDFVSQRVAIAPTDGIITSAYIVVRPRKGTNADYYNYLFKAMDSKKLFHGMGTGIRLTLSFDELKKQLVVCPPKDEKQAIVSYIDGKCAKITSLISELESEIDYLKEYKQRLIADCVTGQVKVI